MALLRLGVLFAVCVASLAARRYDGFQVFSLIPRTAEHTEFLKKLKEVPEVQFWEEVIKIGTPVELLVPPTFVNKLINTPELQNSNLHVLESDIQKSIDEVIARMEERHRNPDLFVYDSGDFNTFDDIQVQLDYLVTQCPSAFQCVVDVIGQSYEGRDLRVFRISQGSGRQIVWIESLIHAREWIAGTTVMKILEKLVTEYGSDSDVTRLLNTYDFYILPVINPDGYIYSWTNDRMWRKSRNINEGTCTGTDINRNFDYHWGGAGSSSWPCSETYCGSSPTSEPETKAIRDEALRIADNTLVWLDIHTAAQGWLTPFGDCVYPPDNADIERAVDVACTAVTNTYGVVYDCGNSCFTLYATTGTVTDTLKNYGIKYAISPELRGPGFNPGQGAIQPAFQENWNGLVAMMNEIDIIEASK